ncbi:MAG: hypothetical protein EBR30_11980, partial [Cytophagia bacterium]|nr:hypothetical protein [Cytophagia bacterium]
MTTLDVRDTLPIILNGVHYEIDLRFYRRNTVDATRALLDQTTENSESSLNSQYLWKRTGNSFELGSGQRLFDTGVSDSRSRYYNSINIDPWTKGEFKLQKEITNRLGNPNRVDAFGPDILEYECVTSQLFIIDDKMILVRQWIDPSYGDWRKWSIDLVNNPTASSWTLTNLAQNSSAQFLRSVVSDSKNIYYSKSGSSGIVRAYYTGGATYSEVNIGDSTQIYYNLLTTGNRLFATRTSGSGSTAVAYFCEINTSTDTVISQYLFNRMPMFTAAIPGPDGIYFSSAPYRDFDANANVEGLNSIIYRSTIDETTGNLNPPSPVVSLPQGEVITTMESYSGYILIGTTKGVRVGQFTATGGITYGPLIEIESSYKGYTKNDWKYHSGVTCFEPEGQYVWFGWSKHYPEIAADEDLGFYTGLGRLDLSQFVDELQPAYAPDLMYSPNYNANREVSSIVTYGGKRYFTVLGLTGNGPSPSFTVGAGKRAGVWGETSNYAIDGWLDTGLVNYDTAEPKRFVRLDVKHKALFDTSAISWQLNDQLNFTAGFGIETSDV